jgi:hypothetical protein
MELDEMKLAWQELEARVRHTQALNFQLLKDNKLNQVRRGLRPLVFGQALQLAIGVAFSAWAAAFWATHLQPLHLLVCGLLVHAYGMLLILFAARNLYLIQRIDYAAPVLDIQRKLVELRAFRVRVEAPVNAVLGCFVWIPVLWMNLAWYGLDLWKRGFMLWALACSLVGLALVVLVVWAMDRLGYARKIKDNSAGRSVLRAQAALDELTRFERE